MNNRAARAVTDTLIIFSGWRGQYLFRAEAMPLPHRRGEEASASEVWLDAEEADADVPDSTLAATGLFGVLGSDWHDLCPGRSPAGPAAFAAPTLRAAWRWIETHFDPRGKLMLYGSYAGGDCAMNLARAIGAWKRFYIEKEGQYHFTPRRPDEGVYGEVRVDLLVTVEAGAGSASEFISRIIPRVVRRNENYFQTRIKPSQQMGRGGPAQAKDSRMTRVVNHDWSGRTDHYGMGLTTRAEVIAAITACRNNKDQK